MKNIKNKLMYFLVVGIGVFGLLFLITNVWIGYSAKNICQEAKWEYHNNDCVTALSLQLDDEKQGFRTRNHAIWALGQFGDSRALPILEKYFTGNIPDREPLDQMISQYELKKAINLAKGGTNITAFFWRFDLD